MTTELPDTDDKFYDTDDKFYYTNDCIATHTPRPRSDGSHTATIPCTRQAKALQTIRTARQTIRSNPTTNGASCFVLWQWLMGVLWLQCYNIASLKIARCEDFLD